MIEQIEIPVSYTVRASVFKLRNEDMSESDEWTGFTHGIVGITSSGKTKEEVIEKLTKLVHIKLEMDAGIDFKTAIENRTT